MKTFKRILILSVLTFAGVCHGSIELSGTLTESIILDPNETYYVTSTVIIPSGIELVIPSETLIVTAEFWGYAFYADTDGTIVTGVPSKHNYVEENISSLQNPIPPVMIVGESGMPFFNNFCGIFILRGASKKCKLDNIYFEGFYYEMQVDQQLEHPITNIHGRGNYNGIISFGSNTIMNSSISFFGMWSPEWQYIGRGFWFVPKNYDQTMIFEDAEFNILNCLADDGDYGYVVYGLYDPYLPPSFYSRDCAATNCYGGFVGLNGNVGFLIENPGLYGNYMDKNFPEMPFTNPVYDVNNPLVFDINDYRIWLNPDSNFVDNGSLNRFPGWTATADNNLNIQGELWPYYQTSIIEPNLVDAGELKQLNDNWLCDVNVPDPVDYNFDGFVDFFDYSILAQDWMESIKYVKFIDLETGDELDSNNLNGETGIRIMFPPPDAEIVNVYLDNEPVGQYWFGMDFLNHYDLIVDTTRFMNGKHKIRISFTDYDGNVKNHEPSTVRFDNLFHMVSAGEHFHSDDGYSYTGFYDGGNNIDVSLKNDMTGATIWTNSYSGDYVNIDIPGSIFSGLNFCELVIEESSMSSSSERTTTAEVSKIIKKKIVKKFKQSDWPGFIRGVIIMPNKDVYGARKPAIYACAQAYTNAGVIWTALYYHDVTPENIEFLYNKSGLAYIYWVGHVNSHVGADPRTGKGGVQRTVKQCWEPHKAPGPWGFGYLTFYTKQGVFSYTRQSVPDAQQLPGIYDQEGFDLGTLNMYNKGYKKIVFIDGCLSGMYNDMAISYGIFSDWNLSHQDQIYIGWKTTVLTTTPGSFWDPVLHSTEGVKMFWERMSKGDDIWDAFYYTVTNGGTGIQETLWGPNGLIDIGDPDSDDNLVIYGYAGSLNIILEP